MEKNYNTKQTDHKYIDTNGLFFYRIGKFVLFDKNPPGGGTWTRKRINPLEDVTVVTARQR